MRGLLMFLAVFASAGCAGGFDCTERGSCANGTVPSQAEVDACKKVVGASDCGAEARALLTCLRDNAKCTSAGDLDGKATLDQCQSASAKLGTCCQAHSDSDACT